MVSSPLRRALGMVLAGLLLTLLPSCDRASPEEQLRGVIGEMQAAAEARDPRAFVEYVSEDFAGTPGELDREGLRNLLRALLLQQRSVGVTLGTMDVKLFGDDRATVKTSALLTGRQGGLLPESGDRIAIESDWRIENGEWRCIAARWTS